MRIGVDARSLEARDRTGVARYLGNILRELAEIAPQNEYTLYFQNSKADDDFLSQGCFRKKLVEMSFVPRKKVLWEQIFLPRELKRNPVDILFCPSYSMPLRGGQKTVVTIHDITYEVEPAWFHPKERLKMRTLTKLAARRADKIISVSEATKCDVVRFYGVEPDKVKVIYEANDPSFKLVKDEAKLGEIKSKYDLSDKFVLYVGSIFARRNIPRLLEALKAVAEKVPTVKLMIIGEDRAYPSQNIGERIKRLGLGNRVVWLDYVPEDDLILLYNVADLFAYPSSYEGFGLPILEAMACGTPVITANLSSLPEVAGDSALYVDPTSVSEMASAMVKVLTGEQIAESLSQRGLQRANSFSWREAAQETLQLFEDLLRGEH